jgi:hypothetical protein
MQPGGCVIGPEKSRTLKQFHEHLGRNFFGPSVPTDQS